MFNVVHIQQGRTPICGINYKKTRLFRSYSKNKHDEMHSFFMLISFYSYSVSTYLIISLSLSFLLIILFIVWKQLLKVEIGSQASNQLSSLDIAVISFSKICEFRHFCILEVKRIRWHTIDLICYGIDKESKKLSARHKFEHCCETRNILKITLLSKSNMSNKIA